MVPRLSSGVGPCQIDPAEIITASRPCSSVCTPRVIKLSYAYITTEVLSDLLEKQAEAKKKGISSNNLNEEDILRLYPPRKTAALCRQLVVHIDTALHHGGSHDTNTSADVNRMDIAHERAVHQN